MLSGARKVEKLYRPILKRDCVMRMAGTTGRAPGCIAKASGIPIHARHTRERAARRPAPVLRAGITLERGPEPSPLLISVAPQPVFVVPRRDFTSAPGTACLGRRLPPRPQQPPARAHALRVPTPWR